MRILIVEDDTEMSEFIAQALDREGYAVDQAPNARKAAGLASEHLYDAILMDVMMPELDGLWLLRTVRQSRHDVVIIMITGKGDIRDKDAAYEGGADDYLVKPFHLSELINKIRVHLKRRHHGTANAILTVGDLRLDLSKRRAWRGSREIRLTPKEFELLEYLMRHKGKIKSQTMILQNVSNVDFNGLSNSIEFHIKNLREKIDKGFPVKLIKTVRGSGYMIDDELSAAA